MTLAGRIALICAVVGMLGAFAPSALARRPPRPNAAIAVYVEQIPTGGGSVAANTEAGGRAKLSPEALRNLRREGGADAAALEKLATAAGLGAPERQTRARIPEPKSAQRNSTNQTPSASLGAPQEDRGPLGLIVVLLLVTGAAVAARLMQSTPKQDRGTADAFSGSRARS